MKNILKYLPIGYLFGKKFDLASNWNKLLLSIENTVIEYEKIIDKNMKIFDINFLEQWKKYLKLPDNVFYFGVNPYQEMLIKLKPKSNKLQDILYVFNQLGINLEIVSNGNNVIEINIISNGNTIAQSALQSELSIELTGGSAIESERNRLQVERYLSAVLPATSIFIVNTI